MTLCKLDPETSDREKPSLGEQLEDAEQNLALNIVDLIQVLTSIGIHVSSEPEGTKQPDEPQLRANFFDTVTSMPGRILSSSRKIARISETISSALHWGKYE